MPEFHRLRVSALRTLTPDARTITLDVPSELREAYRFRPGQHLTFRHPSPDGVVRRTFSICSTPSSGQLSVAVKLLPTGVFSRHVRDQLRVGDELDVLTPAGRFGASEQPTRGPHSHVAVVAGSGITPVMSIMTALLEGDPEVRFVLAYGNRSASTVMFGEEIADLKDRFLDRLEVFHVLSRESSPSPLGTGRIDAAKLETLLELHPPEAVAAWYLCGPLGLVELAEKVLTGVGVDEHRIHREIFFTGQPSAVARTNADLAASITVRIDGRATTLPMPDRGSILDAVLTVRPDAPYACQGGVCGTCRARLVRGEVRMAQHYALTADDLAAGFRLACQSVPVTPEVELDFDG